MSGDKARERGPMFLKVVWFAAGAAMSSSQAFATGLNEAGCEAAIHAGGQTERAVATMRDRVLSSKWVLTMNCEHPEWPARMTLLTETAAEKKAAEVTANTPTTATMPVKAAGTAPVLVRVGETVRVWKQDAMASFETTRSCAGECAGGQAGCG